ncbi:MAG: hypothetical protein M5U11_03505 [Anaerolineales bacterium]|nr:hypothetical protein [Anaerolineales bacterium]MDX9935552.1 hypothetical protein [Anaerolineales bacterium]
MNITSTQVSSVAKLTSGSRIKDTGAGVIGGAGGVTVTECAPLVPHITVNQLPITDTGSLNVIVIFASTATFAAPLVGVVLETLGGKSAKVCPVFRLPKEWDVVFTQEKFP